MAAVCAVILVGGVWLLTDGEDDADVAGASITWSDFEDLDRLAHEETASHIDVTGAVSDDPSRSGRKGPSRLAPNDGHTQVSSESIMGPSLFPVERGEAGTVQATSFESPLLAPAAFDDIQASRVGHAVWLTGVIEEVTD